MKKRYFWVILTGFVIGVAALALTALGNPGNMGFCIACFIRDTSGALKLHSAEVVQYVRPEFIGMFLGAMIVSILAKVFKPRGGSSADDMILAGIVVWWRADVPRLPASHDAAHRRRRSERVDWSRRLYRGHLRRHALAARRIHAQARLSAEPYGRRNDAHHRRSAHGAFGVSAFAVCRE